MRQADVALDPVMDAVRAAVGALLGHFLQDFRVTGAPLKLTMATTPLIYVPPPRPMDGSSNPVGQFDRLPLVLQPGVRQEFRLRFPGAEAQPGTDAGLSQQRLQR